MEQLSVERSIWIGAPREHVWQVLTEPHHIAQWLLPPAMGAQMERDSDGTFFVCMGPMRVPLANIDVVEPQHHARIHSLPDRLLTTTYRLDHANDGTQVTVTITGFEALPADARHDRMEPSATGWEQALANVRAYVDAVDLPFPPGYVAALFGYRREARETYAVERSIWIAAPRERVWRAITDPAQIEQWFSPGTPWRLTAFEIGGRYFVPDPETGAENYPQVIEVIDPPRLFVTRTGVVLHVPAQTTAYLLQEEQSGTRLTITNSGYELEAQETRWQNMEQNAFGFGMMLQNLQAVIEGRELPYPGGF